MEITVTQEDIDIAIRLCNQEHKDIVENCAISIALNRLTGEHWKTGCGSAVNTEGKVLVFPERVWRWISDFDMKRPVSPITFMAEVRSLQG